MALPRRRTRNRRRSRPAPVPRPGPGRCGDMPSILGTARPGTKRRASRRRIAVAPRWAANRAGEAAPNGGGPSPAHGVASPLWRPASGSPCGCGTKRSRSSTRPRRWRSTGSPRRRTGVGCARSTSPGSSPPPTRRRSRSFRHWTRPPGTRRIGWHPTAHFVAFACLMLQKLFHPST